MKISRILVPTLLVALALAPQSRAAGSNGDDDSSRQSTNLFFELDTLAAAFRADEGFDAQCHAGFQHAVVAFGGVVLDVLR